MDRSINACIYHLRHKTKRRRKTKSLRSSGYLKKKKKKEKKFKIEKKVKNVRNNELLLILANVMFGKSSDECKFVVRECLE